MSVKSVYETYYIEDGFNENPTPNEPLNMFCMDDRPPEDSVVGPADFQTAGSLYGWGHDVALTSSALNGWTQHVPNVATYAGRQLSPLVVARLHGGGCAGEKGGPSSPRLVAEADEAELYDGIQALGLNLVASPVEQAIAANKRYAAQQPSMIPPVETSAEILETHPDTRLRRIALVGPHVATTILSDLSEKDVFDTRAAWQAGNPAYNISFGRYERIAFLARGGEPIPRRELEVLLANAAVRHLVTAKALLRHPEEDNSLQILVHQ